MLTKGSSDPMGLLSDAPEDVDLQRRGDEESRPVAQCVDLRFNRSDLPHGLGSEQYAQYPSHDKAGLTSDASAFFLVDQENFGLNLSCQRNGLGLALVKIVPQSGGELPVPDGSAP
jgi:hypothetical protein